MSQNDMAFSILELPKPTIVIKRKHYDKKDYHNTLTLWFLFVFISWLKHNKHKTWKNNLFYLKTKQRILY